MPNKYLVFCKKVLDGPGPGEIVVEFLDYEGIHIQLPVDKSEVFDGGVLGFAVGSALGDRTLIEFSRETSTGAYAVWISNKYLRPYQQDFQVCRKTAVTLAYQWTEKMAGPAPQWIKDAIKDGTIKLPKHAQITVDGNHGDVGSWILKHGKHWMVYGCGYFKAHFVKVDGELKED